MFIPFTNRLPSLVAPALLTGVVVLCTPQAQAQTAPPGAILDVAAASGGSVLSGYQQFTTSFSAAAPSTTVLFAFREQAGYFSFDDASVTAAGSTVNLLADAGFEAATAGTNSPTGWSRFAQSVALTGLGSVASNTALGGCDPNGAHGGSQFWCTGAAEDYEGLYQTLSTQVGQTYDVSFFLADNSGVPLNNSPVGALEFTVDALVYAGAGLPGTAVPEPTSLALLGSGLLGLVCSKRCRRTTT